MSDDIRERHGVESEQKGFVDVREGSTHVTVAVSDGLNPTRLTGITPEAAHYLARQLNRIARRIEKRKEK